MRQESRRSGLVWRSLCGWVVLVSVALVMPDCPAAGGAGKKADPERMFNAKDTNQDGWLSLDEFKVGGKEKKAKNADKRFNPAEATGEAACPFTTLYWDYLSRHADALAKNPRMLMQLKNLNRMSEPQRTAIATQAQAHRAQINR